MSEHKRTNGSDNSPAGRLEAGWTAQPRWRGIARPYTAVEAVRLRGSILVEHTLARHGAERLWRLLQGED